jgi:hypothetical protein
VGEAVEERSDQRRHDRERQHRQGQEERHLVACLTGRHLEEEAAGERDGDRRVAGGVEGVHLDQSREPGAVCTLGVGRATGLADGVAAEAAGHPGDAGDPAAGGPHTLAGDLAGDLRSRAQRAADLLGLLAPLLAGAPRLRRGPRVGHAPILPRRTPKTRTTRPI